jgi:hypothetical protein
MEVESIHDKSKILEALKSWEERLKRSKELERGELAAVAYRYVDLYRQTLEKLRSAELNPAPFDNDAGDE